MKVKLPIVDESTREDDEEILGEQMTYDDFPVREQTFYAVDYIAPMNKKYSIFALSGYEFVVKMGFAELEKKIDKARLIGISDN